MIDLDKDLAEARDILEGRSMKHPTIFHLRAMQIHHEDTLISMANKLGLLHEEIFNLP